MEQQVKKKKGTSDITCPQEMVIFCFPKNVLNSHSDKKDKFPTAAKLKAVNEIYENTAPCLWLSD